MENRFRQIQSEMEVHRKDPYAHPALVGRLQTSADEVHEEHEERISKLEGNWQVAKVLGGIGLIVLGALAAAVFERFTVHGFP